MNGFIEGLLCGLKDLVFPRTCLVCRQSLGRGPGEELVCPKCWSLIIKNVPPFCGRCGRHLDPGDSRGRLCRTCLKNELYFERAYSPCVYEGPIKTLIREFKYRNKDYLARTLGQLMVDFIREYGIPVESLDMVMAVPLYPARLREREFNQAELLAEEIAAAFGKQLCRDNLERVRNTAAQAQLEAHRRSANVLGAFALKRPGLVKDKNILLVDDVMTTAATSSEAARVLRDAGANRILVITLAN